MRKLRTFVLNIVTNISIPLAGSSLDLSWKSYVLSFSICHKISNILAGDKKLLNYTKMEINLQGHFLPSKRIHIKVIKNVNPITNRHTKQILLLLQIFYLSFVYTKMKCYALSHTVFLNFLKILLIRKQLLKCEVLLQINYLQLWYHSKVIMLI